MEPRVFELHVGAGLVGEVYVGPWSIAVEVVDLSVGVVCVGWVTSESAGGGAGCSDAGVGYPSVGPCFDHGEAN